MKYLITGGCGFIGSNLVCNIIQNNSEAIVFDNLSRSGSTDNLEWLKKTGDFIFSNGDIRSYNDISRVIKQFSPDVIFHLAGQVAMTCSLNNPRLDFETNTLGTFNLLEAVKEYSPKSIVVYSSTNKVYGDLEAVKYKELDLRYVSEEYPDGFDENCPLNFTTPYGCSKGAADQYVLDYAKMFGLSTIVFRHSSVFGERQFGTYDQGWIGWFVKQAVETIMDPRRPSFTISGNGKQVRDVLFVTDLVQCYFKAVKAIEKCKGQSFNIGGGMGNSISLLELLLFLEKELNVDLRYKSIPWRQSDQKIFVANINKAKCVLDWCPTIAKDEGLRKMITWVKNGYTN